MSEQYYLNKEGLITLVKSISNSIKEHTSGEIIKDSNGNIQNPNNFVTAKAVAEYVKNKNNLIINQDTTSKILNSYDIVNNTINYNGDSEVEININLISSDEINNLF